MLYGKAVLYFQVNRVLYLTKINIYIFESGNIFLNANYCQASATDTLRIANILNRCFFIYFFIYK